jgi:hypothetical protein
MSCTLLYKEGKGMEEEKLLLKYRNKTYDFSAKKTRIRSEYPFLGYYLFV